MPPSAFTKANTKMLLLSFGPGRKLAFWLGLVVSLAAGLSIDLTGDLGVDKGIATSLVLTCMIVIMWSIYHEKVAINVWSVVLLIGGGALGVVSDHFAVGSKVIVHTSNSFDVWIYLINLGVVIPLFEELSVRRLMFLGASHWAGPWLSAILVSILFALMHNGMFAFAFSISILLCAATYCGMDTVNRSIFHGSYNLAIAVQLLCHAS